MCSCEGKEKERDALAKASWRDCARRRGKDEWSNGRWLSYYVFAYRVTDGPHHIQILLISLRICEYGYCVDCFYPVVIYLQQILLLHWYIRCKCFRFVYDIFVYNYAYRLYFCDVRKCECECDSVLIYELQSQLELLNFESCEKL